MTSPTTTRQGSDPWEMALIHRLIRRGFERSREVVLAPGATARAGAVGEYVGFHLDGLEAHHSTEDELVWPVRTGPSAGRSPRNTGLTSSPSTTLRTPLHAACRCAARAVLLAPQRVAQGPRQGCPGRAWVRSFGSESRPV